MKKRVQVSDLFDNNWQLFWQKNSQHFGRKTRTLSIAHHRTFKTVHRNRGLF